MGDAGWMAMILVTFAPTTASPVHVQWPLLRTIRLWKPVCQSSARLVRRSSKKWGRCATFVLNAAHQTKPLFSADPCVRVPHLFPKPLFFLHMLSLLDGEISPGLIYQSSWIFVACWENPSAGWRLKNQFGVHVRGERVRVLDDRNNFLSNLHGLRLSLSLLLHFHSFFSPPPLPPATLFLFLSKNRLASAMNPVYSPVQPGTPYGNPKNMAFTGETNTHVY